MSEASMKSVQNAIWLTPSNSPSQFSLPDH
jgi:hypothetical protein